jgi:rhamnulokinase
MNRADRATATVAAVDLGASSGRVVVGRFTTDHVELHEVHRFPNIPVRAGRTLRWDVLSLFNGVLDGLRAARQRFGGLDGLGVDAWGVDYGLLDADGELLGNPSCYREPGTEPTVAAVLADVGASELYAATGIQLQPFNTLFQLLARRESAQARAARHALLVPDLFAYWLCGSMGTELTNASTTQLLDPRTMDWSRALADRLQVPIDLFPALRKPGERLGALRPAFGLGDGTALIAVPSHDTAASVAGIPADGPDFAYVCTGTWALVGVELPDPVITAASRQANFTNEVGVDGTVRFLRNVTGFWLLQECIRQWRQEGADVDAAGLTDAATDVVGLRAIIDVQDPEFAAPGDMPGRIRDAARRTSGATIDGQVEIVRCILDSMALATRHAVRDAVALSGRTVRAVHVVGGGVSSRLFCQLVADACGLPVVAGPTEAASWGNVLSQARTLGVVGDSLADTRAVIRHNEQPVVYPASGDEREWARVDQLVPGGAR